MVGPSDVGLSDVGESEFGVCDGPTVLGDVEGDTDAGEYVTPQATDRL